MRLTFEGENLNQIFHQMADVLGVKRETQPNGVGGRRGGKSYSDWAERANEAADEAGKALDAKEAPPPTPAVLKILQDGGVPESEYELVGRSGKGNKITQTDAKAYVKARVIKAADDEVDANVKAPREFPAPQPPAAPEGTLAAETPAAQESPSAPAAETPTEQNAEAPVFTFNDVKSKLTTLNNERGMKNTIASLARFGVDRISALREDQYAGFIDYADKVIAKEIDPLAAEQ